MSRVDDALNRIAEAMSTGVRLHEAAMSYRDAVALFRKLGVDPATLDAPALKKAYRRLAMQHHPDQSGDATIFKELSSAWDTLQKGGGGAQYTSYTPPDEASDYPQWANAGYSGGMRHNPRIRREDYSDVNYVKKRMWELSGESRQEWTIWSFDGNYFRGCTTVYGNPSIFHDMADAMLELDDKFFNKKAIFVNRRDGHDLLLIWLDGEYIDPPIPFEHDSFNANPGNDQSFTRGLTAELEQVKQTRTPKLD
jgi:hypothetical protein